MQRDYRSDFGPEDEQRFAEAAMTGEAGALRVTLSEHPTIVATPDVELGGSSFEPVVRYRTPPNYASLPIGEWGWRQISDTKYLLERFLRLPADPELILKFAKDYGPLWIVNPADWRQQIFATRTEDEPEVLAYLAAQDRFEELHRPQKSVLVSVNPRTQGMQMWPGYERLSDWRVCILEVRTAVRTIAALQHDPPQSVPEENASILLGALDGSDFQQSAIRNLWKEQIYPHSELRRLGMLEPYIIQPALVACIHHYLVQDPGSSRLVTNWQTLQLKLYPGLGFLRTVWLMVAQVASREKGAYVCSSCANPFVRPYGVRSAKRGQNTFCATCGINERGAKKINADKRRKKLRALVDLLGTEAQNGPLDWDRLLADWNQRHPQWQFPTVEAMLSPLRKRSPDVNVDSIAHLLEGPK